MVVYMGKYIENPLLSSRSATFFSVRGIVYKAYQAASPRSEPDFIAVISSNVSTMISSPKEFTDFVRKYTFKYVKNETPTPFKTLK